MVLKKVLFLSLVFGISISCSLPILFEQNEGDYTEEVYTAEDIAEVWIHFVVQALPDGDTVTEQKILFFYDYPELVELRSEIASRTVSRFRR